MRAAPAITRRHFLRAASICSAMVARPAFAADPIRIAAQKTGTLAWELEVVRAHGLAAKYGLDLSISILASPEAQKIALKAGSVDLIVGDLVWVAREHALGGSLRYVPFSTSTGSVMVPPGSPIATLEGLKGRRIAVGGGPLDKGWTFLRAVMLRKGIDLLKEAEPVYGAPPLLNQKALQGEVDAILNYWNFGAVLETAGFRTLATGRELQLAVGATAPIALLGYVFESRWASSHPDRIERLLSMMGEAKALLSRSDEDWVRLAHLTGTSDLSLLNRLKAGYRDGLPDRAVHDEIADARKLFDILISVGGTRLTGNLSGLDPAVYYQRAKER